MPVTAAPQKQKRIVARSRGTYRGVVIIEVPSGFLIFIGAQSHVEETLDAMKNYIDKHCVTGRN